MSERTYAEQVMAAIAEPFPADLFQEKNNKSYVETEYYRQRLNDATNGCYDWDFISQDYRKDQALKPVMVKGPDGKPTTQTVEPWVAVYVGKLTIHGVGSRVGIGVQEIQAGGGADSAYKGAESDAFKRACMAFGMGLRQLYIETNKHEQQKARAEAAQANRAPQPITDDEFTKRAVASIKSRDAAEYRAVVELAGASVRRWSVLIFHASSEQSLDWIKNHIPARLLDDKLIRTEIANREQKFREAEAPKPIADTHQLEGKVDTAPAEPNPPRPATDGQIDTIRSLCRRLDLSEEDTTVILASIHDVDDARAEIARLTAEFSAGVPAEHAAESA